MDIAVDVGRNWSGENDMNKLSDRWMYYSGLLAMHGVGVEDLKHIQNLIDAEDQPTIEAVEVVERNKIIDEFAELCKADIMCKTFGL